MSRYRLLPSPAQEAVLRDHCGHARFIWNLAVEQHRHWRPGRASAPGYLEQCRQLTAARAEHPWLAAGSQMVQQQALRDFAQARANYAGGTHGRPSWRKAGRDEGFRVVVVQARRGAPPVPPRRAGACAEGRWVRFRWSRAVPAGVKSYRVTMDRAGRWHVAFTAVPGRSPRPATARRWASTAAWRCPPPCPPVNSCALPGWAPRNARACCAWNASSPAPGAARTAAGG